VAIFGDGEDPAPDACGPPVFAAGFTGGSTTDATSGSTALAGSNDICVFDEHYAVFVAQTNTGLVLTFNNDESANPAPGTTTCAAADTAETNRLGTSEVVTACLSDQNGNRANGTVTFESRGVGTLTCNGVGATATTPVAGTTGDTQRCTAPAVNGRATATLTNAAEVQNQGPTAGGRNRAPGDQTVTACVDRPATNSNPVGCGSADTPISNAVVKTWITTPRNVALVFADGGPASGCVGGDTFKVNTVGDTDTLRACVTDVNGNPTTTQNTGNTGETENQFTVRFTFNNVFQNRVAFASNPPTETDANGQAQVTIRALSEGSETIQVQLFNGINDPIATVTKTVQSGPGTTTSPGPTQTVTIRPTEQPNEIRHDRKARITNFRHIRLPGKRKPALRVRGDVRVPDGFNACLRQVPVKVQIRLGGEFITRKSDTTNDNGVFRVLIRDIKARYRVTAVRHEVADVFNNDNHICQRARGARRHRH
jgi:hypothetical protein